MPDSDGSSYVAAAEGDEALGELEDGVCGAARELV